MRGPDVTQEGLFVTRQFAAQSPCAGVDRREMCVRGVHLRENDGKLGDILDWFKVRVNEAAGGNYQSLTNEVLKGHIQQEGLERALRS